MLTSNKSIPEQPKSLDDKMLKFALSALAESPALNTESNKNCIINNKSCAHTFLRIIFTLQEASPKLDTQQNFDLLIANTPHLRKIADIFCGLNSELQTQENFTSLFQCTDSLDTIINAINTRLPYTGGTNPNPPLDQENFNKIVNETREQAHNFRR